MKTLKFAIAIAAAMAISLPASAQFRFGVKAGLDINTVHISGEDFKNNNRNGFTAGLTAEYGLPVQGLALDLSVMYAHRNTAYGVAFNGIVPGELEPSTICDVRTRKQDYIEIPLNIKYKFSIPAVEVKLAPYLATGPSVAFRCSEDKSQVGYFSKTTDAAWNFGAGVEIIEHVQVGATYSLGFLDTIDEQFKPAWEDLKATNRGWKITATYFF